MTSRAFIVAIGVAILGAAFTIVEIAIDPRRAAFAYLAALAVAASTALAALIFVMIGHVAHAGWLVVMRRVPMAIASTLPLLLVLFVPVVLAIHLLYPWAQPLAHASEPTRRWAEHVRGWASPGFFIARAYFYIVVWSALAWLLRRAEGEEDAGVRPSEAIARRQRLVSVIGLPIVALTSSFASFDWFMSVNPSWYSDIFGMYFFAGGFASALGVTAIGAYFVHRARHWPDEVGPAHFHALGRVMLVSVILWAYLGFVQFLLVWIANLPNEVPFFGSRAKDGWAQLSAVLFCAHFAAPLPLLLQRTLKRRPFALALVGAWLVAAHAIDSYWLVVPAVGAGPRLLDAAPVFGVGALFVAFGMWRFDAARPFPIHDPALAESLVYESP